MFGQRKQIEGLKDNLQVDLEKRLIEHRNRFVSIFLGRYKELLPSLITYENIEDTSLNPLKMEVVLRDGFNLVIGKASNDNLMILGYVNNNKSYEDVAHFLSSDLIQKDDIHFVVAKDIIPKDMKEISLYDDCKTGNFIVLRNKALNYVDDMKILQHYTMELSEIVLSRLSLAMQSKINTFLIGRKGDESINEIARDLYNGSPFIKINKFFDPKEDIVTLDNVQLSQNFVELKKEYQNKISELNTMLGINSLAVEKESGVSDIEAKGDRGFKTSNSNIYLKSRQNELDKLNKRYSLDIQVNYNDDVKSELEETGKIERMDNKEGESDEYD